MRLSALCLVAAAVLLGGCGGRPASTSGTVFRLDPRSGEARSRTAVPGRPCGLAPGWVVDIQPPSLYRIGAKARRTALAAKRPCGIATGLGAVWIGTGNGKIMRVPPGRAFATGARSGLGNLTVYAGAVWAADLGGDVIRLRGGALSRVRGVGETEQLAGLAGALWAIAAGPGQLVRIDVRTLAVRRFPIGASPKAIATGDGGVWVALTDRRLLRFDPARGRAREVGRLPEAPILLAAGGGTVWSLPAGGRLSAVDERTGRTRLVRDFGRPPFGLALAPDALWVGTR
jgi:streptogramin lyase